MIILNPLAPALANYRASSLISCSTRAAVGLSPSNTQQLRCFQSIHAVRIAREPKPFLKQRGAALGENSHQTKKSETSVSGVVVRWHQDRTSCQTYRERWHPTRCWIISWLWSHKWHRAWWSTIHVAGDAEPSSSGPGLPTRWKIICVVVPKLSKSCANVVRLWSLGRVENSRIL